MGGVEKEEKMRLVQALVEFIFQSWRQEQPTFRRHAEQIDNGALGRGSQKLLWEQSVL